MTPAGHLSISYISGRFVKNISLPAIIIGGILPDIDFFFVGFDWFNRYHHVVTHNLLFIILTALFTSFHRSWIPGKRVAPALLLGSFLHLIVDSFMDNNPTNGIGIALLWPFYAGFFSPFNILSDAGNKTGWSDPVSMIKPMLLVMLYEVPLYATSMFLFLRKKRLTPTSRLS